MGIIFERKGNVATFYDAGEEVTGRIEVPGDRTVVSVIGSNEVFDGEVYESDGYVYEGETRKRLRKWWSFRQGWAHFWEPCLQDVARIERVYHGVQRRIGTCYGPRVATLLRAIIARNRTHVRYGQKGYIAHVKPWHEFKRSGDHTWWRYHVHDCPLSEGWTFIFDWVSPPKAPENVDLGEALYRHTHIYAKSLFGRSSRLADILEEALLKYIRRTFQAPRTAADRAQYRVTVNGRDYWYQGHLLNSSWTIERLSWPRDKPLHASVGVSLDS
jgi:hypothetical protein